MLSWQKLIFIDFFTSKSAEMGYEAHAIVVNVGANERLTGRLFLMQQVATADGF